jgi:hypothetical protein
LNNIKCESSKILWNRKSECLKENINELEANSKNKNDRDLHRGTYGFKKGYQPKSNLVTVGNGDVLAYSQSILNRQKNYFFQLLNVHGTDDVWQIKMHTAEPLVPKLSPFEVEIGIEKLKRYKSSSTDQILAELIQAGGNT